MWVLMLNPMRDRSENIRPVAFAPTKAELEAFVASETVPPYTEEGSSPWHNASHTYHKIFRKDGPLSWFNGPRDGSYSDVGTEDQAADNARRGWRSFFRKPELVNVAGIQVPL